MLVALLDSIEQLEQEGFYISHAQAFRTYSVQQLFQVAVQELEYQSQLFVGVEHIDEPDNVRVLELLQKGNLTDGSTGNALVFAFKPNFLESSNLVGVYISGLVHHSVGAFSYAL